MVIANRLLTTLLLNGVLGWLPADGAAAAPELNSALSLDVPSNSVTTTSDGTVFVGFPRLMGEAGVKVARIVDGKPTAFPDEAWNSWKEGADASHAFVRFNAMRIGTDGKLWVVDVGSPMINEPVVAGGPKILVFDPATGTLLRSYVLPESVIYPRSFIDDLRFNGDTAYITDAGIPGLILLDLKSGATRRVLDRQPSTTDQQPMRARGRMLYGPDGKKVEVHSDQLEVSPDGKYLYYMPCSGPLYRVATHDLADTSLTDVQLEQKVTLFAKVGTTGGTAIDAAGNLYVSDTDRSRILKIAASGETETLIADDRLHWPDAMWIDRDGFLWIPTPQMDRTPAFNAGRDSVKLPVHMFKVQIGAKPSPIDHP